MRVTLYCFVTAQQNKTMGKILTDQSSDGFTINDVLDTNDRHYCKIFSMDARHQTIFSILNQQIHVVAYVGTIKYEDPFQASFFFFFTFYRV